MRYRPTLDIWTLTPAARAALPVGQWVSAGPADPSRANCGRWCGVSAGGSDVVAWNGNARRHANRTAYRRALRQYATGGRMTIADKFAALFKNDGQQWMTADGRYWDKVADGMGGVSETRSHDDATRYTFPDGSVITAVGDAWDHGFPDCWCWAGCPRDGHEDGRCGAGEGGSLARRLP